jgi:hypothetical protein
MNLFGVGQFGPELGGSLCAGIGGSVCTGMGGSLYSGFCRYRAKINYRESSNTSEHKKAMKEVI